MEYIYLGKISTTHGLKGELKIRSNFKYKDKIFKIGNYLYLGDERKELEIIRYRPHQEFDMVTFKGLDNIELVLKYKGLKVYFDKTILELGENEYLNEDLIGLKVYFEEELLGVVDDIQDQGNGNEVMEILGEKRVLIPKNMYFIDKINIKNQEMTLKNVKGMV